MFYTEQTNNVHCLPVCHYRIEFAQLVRQAIDQVKPDAIAVELPPTLEDRIRQGISLLPSISVLLYENHRGESVYLLVEPADAEALGKALIGVMTNRGCAGRLADAAKRAFEESFTVSAMMDRIHALYETALAERE